MLSLIEKIAPGTVDLLSRRYSILEEIEYSGPIGRRALAGRLGIKERILRSDIDVLKEQELIMTSSKGTGITSKGYETMKKLEALKKQFIGSKEKETQLANVLDIHQSIIVSGDADKDADVTHQLGQSTSELFDILLPEGPQVVAVMGGTTMSHVADGFDQGFGQNRDLLFIPARGGLGESVDIQANTVAEKMAKKSGGKSQMLHAPEHVSSKTYSLLLEEPEIKETLKKLKQASMVLYSIGDAYEMAERRGMSDDVFNMLKEKRACAEAFGEFIDADGQVVYKLSRIGLESKELGSIEHVIAVAGGKHKAKAIEAHVKTAPSHTWLVTDEAVANEILNGETP